MLGNIIGIISKVYTLAKGSRFFWSLIKNYGVLKKNIGVIGDIIKKCHAENRTVPNCEEGQSLMIAISNILKTEVIDLPGLDEYSLAVSIDEISGTLVCELTDKVSNKKFKLAGGRQ